MSIARIRKNDTVIVTHGNDAGRTGVVQSVDRKKGTAIVSGINVHKKAVRRTERHGHHAGDSGRGSHGRICERPVERGGYCRDDRLFGQRCDRNASGKP